MVTAHDDPKSYVASLHNSALSVLERAGHTVVNSELYVQKFNPVTSSLDFNTSSGAHADYMYEQQRAINTGSGFSPDIQAEMDKVKSADLIILNFPLWWGGPPAILKGWLDKVLAMGFAWNADSKYQQGLMRGKKVLVTLAVGDPESFYGPNGMHRASVQQHLYGLLHSTLAYCGFDVLSPFVVMNTTAAAPEELASSLEQYSKFLSNIESTSSFIYKQASN